RRRQLAQGVLLAQLGLDRFLAGAVLALAEVEPGQGAAHLPEEEAWPALAAVGMPEAALGVDGNREFDLEASQARRHRVTVAAEGKARSLDAERGQPVWLVAARPLGYVGKRPDAVDLRVVEEVDQHRTA